MWGEQRAAVCWQALLTKMRIWVERVASDDNISDLPSREAYEIMPELGAGAKWRAPVIARMFLDGVQGMLEQPAARHQCMSWATACRECSTRFWMAHSCAEE